MLDQYKELSLAERVGRLKTIFAKRKIKASGNGKVIDSSNHYRDKSTTYIALEDFLADAIVECENLGLVPTVTFDVPGKPNLAALIMTDATGKEPPFTPWTAVPTEKASGLVEDLQAIGSQIKYTRRYLWTTFLDLVEHDALEDGEFNDEIRAVNGLIQESETKNEIPQTAPEKPTCNYRQATVPKPAAAPEPELQPVSLNVYDGLSPTDYQNTPAQPYQNQPARQYQNMPQQPVQNNYSSDYQNQGYQNLAPNEQLYQQPQPEPVPSSEMYPPQNMQSYIPPEQSYTPMSSQPQPAVSNVYTQRPDNTVYQNQRQNVSNQPVQNTASTQQPAQPQMNNQAAAPSQNTQGKLSEEDYLRTLSSEEVIRRRLRYMSLKNGLKDMNKDEVINLVLQLYDVKPGSPAASKTTASLQAKPESELKNKTFGILNNSITLCDKVLVDSSLNNH